MCDVRVKNDMDKKDGGRGDVLVDEGRGVWEKGKIIRGNVWDSLPSRYDKSI